MTRVVNMRYVAGILGENLPGKGSEASEDMLQCGLERGYLEPQDVVDPYAPVCRRQLAGIIHRFLRIVLDEPDIDNWQTAQRLRDLYDCRTCVNHVAQVYGKGIMPGISGDVFGMEEKITEQELQEIIWRMFHDETRLKVGKEGVTAMSEEKWIRITCEQARKLREETGMRLIDVRTREEFDAYHLPGAELFPVDLVQADPAIVGGDRKAPLLVGCRSGHRSEIAARALAGIGYETIYFFGLESSL